MQSKYKVMIFATAAASLASCKSPDQSAVLADPVIASKNAIEVLEQDRARFTVGRILTAQETDDAIFGKGAVRPQAARQVARFIETGSCTSDAIAGFEVVGSKDIIGRMTVVWTYDLRGEAPQAVIGDELTAKHNQECERTKAKGVMRSVSLHRVGTDSAASGDSEQFNNRAIGFGANGLSGKLLQEVELGTDSLSEARAYCASTLNAAGIKHNYHVNRLCRFNLVRQRANSPASSAIQKPLTAGESVIIQLSQLDIYAFKVATVSPGSPAKQGDARLMLVPPSAKGKKATEMSLIKSRFKPGTNDVEFSAVYRLNRKPSGQLSDFQVNESNLLFQLHADQVESIEQPRRPRSADEDGVIEADLSEGASRTQTATLKATRVDCKSAFAMVQKRAPEGIENLTCSVETDAGLGSRDMFTTIVGNEGQFSGEEGLSSNVGPESDLYKDNGMFSRLGVGGGKGFNRGVAIQELMVVIRVN